MEQCTYKWILIFDNNSHEIYIKVSENECMITPTFNIDNFFIIQIWEKYFCNLGN